jgi:hypothetical protein
MNQYGLVAHLALRFAPHPENLATESLAFILQGSKTARSAVTRSLNRAGAGLPADLSFRSQVHGEDNAIPDLIGIDNEGRTRLILEAKFWAGLTDNQPLTYLARLPQQVESHLVFVVPARRIESVWSEILRRCQDGKRELAGETSSTEYRSIRVGSTSTMAIISWRLLLADIRRSLQDAQEVQSLADVVQLEVLCARMDEQDFLPLRAEELGSDRGLRIMQLCSIVNAVADAGIREKLLGPRPAKKSKYVETGLYGRYVLIHGLESLLNLSCSMWSKYRETPIWLTILDRDWVWKLRADALAALSELTSASPPRAIVGKYGLYIPLFVPTQVEKHDVEKSLLTQLRLVRDLLASKLGPLAPVPEPLAATGQAATPSEMEDDSDSE